MMWLKLTDDQWEGVCHHFPADAEGQGPSPVRARHAFEAVLWVLHTDAPWSLLPQCYPQHEVVQRRYQAWVRDGVLKRAIEDLAETVERELTDGPEAYFDSSFARAGVGDAKPGNLLKIMAIEDRPEPPLWLSTHPVHPRETTLELDLDSVATESPDIEDVIQLWDLHPSERSQLAKMALGEKAVSDVAKATKHMQQYLKPESIAKVVRRRGDAVDGVSLVSMLLDGKTDQILEECRDMFRFENVHG